MLRNTPIRRKLMTILLLTSGIVLLVTCTAFLAYEFVTFRRSAVGQLSVLGRITASNSTAALAFANPDDAGEILGALRAEPHIIGAALYDRDGRLFAVYPDTLPPDSVPATVLEDGYRFEHGHLIGFAPVVEGENRRLGTLYLHANMDALWDRLKLYGTIAAMVIAVSLLVAYLLARKLQQQISLPILGLARTATAISERQDYSVRAPAGGNDELGRLTGAFNQMLTRIQAQNEALKESEGRQRAVVESALDGIVAMNHEGIIVAFNPAAERIFGYGAADVIGRPLADVIVPPALRDAHRRGLARYLARGEGPVIGRRVELEGLRADGAIIPVELSISRMPGDGPPMFTGFLRDITERKHAEEKVQAQLARHDLLNRITRGIGERQDLASIFQVVIRHLEDTLPIDFGCVCLYDAREGSLNITGVGAKSPPLSSQLMSGDQSSIPIDGNGLGRCVMGQLVYEADITGVATRFTQLLAQHGLRSLTASPLLFESQVFGVLLAARREPHAFTSMDCEFLRQLSEHVALAAHQAQTNTALQTAYDELRQSQQTVLQQERLRALGEMASGIAHDINNAISPVVLYTQMLLESEAGLSAEGREYLETIERGVEDVAATVARMREFYRPREPQLTLAPANLNDLAQQIITLTRARWFDMPQQRGVVVEIRLELASHVPAVMVAESEIREALTNLVFNAVDAMPQGGVLTIRTLVNPKTPASPPKVVIEVTDTGLGMDEATRLRCLEPFFTTKGERGTGLGLAMVYGVMQRHSAGLEIESTPGRGTTVRLIFDVPALIDTGGPSPVAYRIPSRLRILVVDDDPLLLKSLRDTLMHDGHEVTTASGGQEGIDTFRAASDGPTPFAVVFTDLGMPHVDGRAVSRAIKEISPITPVIMLTGWGQRLQAENDIPPHVDLLLSKPPKLRDLREALIQCASGGPP
jgi:PAS domain S-box-containing protein